MEIVGCPVGSSAFCKNFVDKTLKTILNHTDNLTLLHPQAASKLLMKCVAPAPAYLSQTCHASVTNQPFKRFDKALWELWVSILGGIGLEKDQLGYV